MYWEPPRARVILSPVTGTSSSSRLFSQPVNALPVPGNAPSLGSIGGLGLYRRSGTGKLSHPVLGNARYTLTPVQAGGDGQTADVISLMRRYAVEDAAHPHIREQARLIRAEAATQGMAPYEAAYWWVKNRLRFVRDEITATPVHGIEGLGADDVIVETLIRPADMAALPEGSRVGDCDDYSMYLASLLTALGYDAAYATIAADQNSNDYSHVYVVIRDNGVRVPLDASHGGYPGWEAPEAGRTSRYREWPVGGGVSEWGVVILLIGAWWLCKYRHGLR